MSVLIEREIENDFNKYNWIDVKEYARQIFAEGIFNDITYEIYWAEDMWNILMFESVIDSTNVIKAELSDHKIGDSILWIMAMYDVYYDYKICIEFESKWRIDILEYLYKIDNWEEYISKYLYDLIYKELNLEIVEGELDEVEFYDIKNDNFNYEYDSVLNGNMKRNYRMFEIKHLFLYLE